MFFVCACVWCDDPAVLENSGGDDTVQTHFLHYNAKMQWNGQPHFSSFWSVMCSIFFFVSVGGHVLICHHYVVIYEDVKELLHHAATRGSASTQSIGLKPGKSTDAFSSSREVASRHQQMGPRAISPCELVRSGTTPLGGACFLTTHQWEFSCFWNSPPELPMF